jgi:hypothetical protein
MAHLPPSRELLSPVLAEAEAQETQALQAERVAVEQEPQKMRTEHLEPQTPEGAVEALGKTLSPAEMAVQVL